MMILMRRWDGDRSFLNMRELMATKRCCAYLLHELLHGFAGWSIKTALPRIVQKGGKW
jgi:hypothetical protein